MERATELEWLKWFYYHSDLCFEDEDSIHYLKRKFVKDNNLSLPIGYDEDKH